MLSPILAALIAAGLLVFLIGATWLWRRNRALRQQIEADEQICRRNQAIVDGSGEGVLELDDTGKVVFANASALRLLGYESDRDLQFDYRQLLGASDYLGQRDTTRIGYTTDMLCGIGAVLRCRDGRLRPVEYRMLPLRRSDSAKLAPRSAVNASPNASASSLLVFRDLTERARIDVMLADLQHMAKVGAWEAGIGSARCSVSEGITRRLQLPPGRTLRARDLLRRFTAEARHTLLNAARVAIRHGQSFDLELQVRADGGVRDVEWFRVMGKAERVDGVTLRLYGTAQDISGRKQAEVRLRETTEFFGATIDALPSAVMFFDDAERLTYCNRSPLAQWLEFRVPDGQTTLREALGSHAQQLEDDLRRGLVGQDTQWLRPFVRGDESRQIQCNFIPRAGGQGRRGGCWVVLTDVTELKLLEARLYQAEKMQAVGQLTGGVAHDFNNLLGVILGNLQLLERDLPSDDAVQRKLSTAVRAALRGSELTRRLLSFARREPLDSRVIDLNLQLQGLTDLIQQTLGDRISLRLTLDEACWPVKVDVGQLENAILNLALNARDAMPQGGTLTLTTRNLHPGAAFFMAHPDLTRGDYVELSVADTGKGIPPQLINRIFEPFFTTKEIGKGSGLGLAMVHGFVKQSSGAISAHSDIGRGTSFVLYLPRSQRAVAVPESQAPAAMASGRGEVVLVVEDDTDLRATTVLALQEEGYSVREASSAEAAMALLEMRGNVDLLFADVILPGGMLGSDLATRAMAIKPGIQVLLTTGYQGEVSTVMGGAAGRLPLLIKPYRRDELAAKIRALLDSRTHETSI